MNNVIPIDRVRSVTPHATCPECHDDLRPDGSHTGNSYFGVCPECRSNDGYINVGKGHWFFCAADKVCWLAGVNLFSTWHGESEEQQLAQHDALGFSSFRNVKPHYCSIERKELRA